MQGGRPMQANAPAPALRLRRGVGMSERIIAAGVEGHTVSLRLKSRGHQVSRDVASCTCGWGVARSRVVDGKGGTKDEPLTDLRGRANAHLFAAWKAARQGTLEV